MADDLVALTYSEFDYHLGPVQRYSHPPNVLSDKQFDYISDYLIVENPWSERLLTLRVDNFLIIALPIIIENSKYFRNSLNFTFSFVVKYEHVSLNNMNSQTNVVISNPKENLEIYIKALKNISLFFKDIEIQHEVIFRSEIKEQLVPEVIKLFYDELIKNHAVFLSINLSSLVDKHLPTLFLSSKLYKSPAFSLFSSDRPSYGKMLIEDYHVPIFRYDRIHLINLPYDVTFQYLILYIDGISTVKTIADESAIDLDIVKKGLQILNFHQVVIIADRFKYSNRYEINHNFPYQIINTFNYPHDQTSQPDPNLSHPGHTHAPKLSSLNTGITYLLHDPSLIVEMRDFAGYEYKLHNAQLPDPIEILKFLLTITSSKSIGDILIENMTPIELNNDEKMRILFPDLKTQEKQSSPSPSNSPSPTPETWNKPSENYDSEYPFLNDETDDVLLQSVHSVSTVNESNNNIDKLNQSTPNISNQTNINTNNSKKSSSNKYTRPNSTSPHPRETNNNDSSVPFELNGNDSFLSQVPDFFLFSLKYIDISRLLAFAQYKGIIRRVYEYPIFLGEENNLTQPSSPSRATPVPSNIIDSTSTDPFQSNPTMTQSDKTFPRLVSQSRSVSNFPPIPLTSNFTSSNKSIGGGVNGNSRKGKDSTPMLATEDSVRDFSLMTTKSKTVLESKYINQTNIHLEDIDWKALEKDMNGTLHLDALCCKYNISHQDIYENFNLCIIYK